EVPQSPAAKSIQSAQTPVPSDSPQTTEPGLTRLDTVFASSREIKIPPGTPLEIEAAHTVTSLSVRPNDFLSFRVLIPIKIDGVTLIEGNALVTGRVVEAKRGGHWGKAGRLTWIMLDVVAADGTRVPLQAKKDLSSDKNGIRGTSHGGEVAATSV